MRAVDTDKDARRRQGAAARRPRSVSTITARMAKGNVLPANRHARRRCIIRPTNGGSHAHLCRSVGIHPRLHRPNLSSKAQQGQEGE
ncbi:MAG: hypothetical protein V4579_13755 [Pseudomonadota bacterium]